MTLNHPHPDCSLRERDDGSRSHSHDSNTFSQGQSTLVGVLLLFGILIALLAIIQLTAVPGWNQAIEVQHNERAQGDLRDVMGDIHHVGHVGQTRTSTVELGVGYPTRPFLLNPPATSGRLQSTESQPFEIRNVDIRGVDNYWTNESEEGVIGGSTHQLIYEPNYNEHEDAPRTVYENGVLYNEIDERAVLATEPFIDDNRISLIALSGDTDITSTSQISVPVRPESAPSQTVAVSSAGEDPVTVTVPTRLPEAEWESLLTTEFQRNDGHIVGDEGGVTVENGELTVTLAADAEYELELAQVTVDDRADRTEPHYITDISGAETPLRSNRGERLVFEVRDEFNNPKSGVNVTFEASAGFLSQTSARTDSDGRVAIRYTTPPEPGIQSVTATADIEGGAEPAVNEQVTVPISVVDDGATDDQFIGANPPPGSDRVQLIESVRIQTGTDIIFRNGKDTEMTLTQIRPAFYHAGETPFTPNSGTYQYGTFETDFAIPDQFIPVEGPTLAPGEEDTIAIRDLRPNPTGDLMLIHAVWVDEFGEAHTHSYFVSLTN